MVSLSLSRDDSPGELDPICDRLMGKAVQLGMLMKRDKETSQPDLEHVFVSVQPYIGHCCVLQSRADNARNLKVDISSLIEAWYLVCGCLRNQDVTTRI
jgi:hypothetical protein